MAAVPRERPLGQPARVIPIKRGKWQRRWRGRVVNPASMPTGGKYGWVVWAMLAVFAFLTVVKVVLEAAGFEPAGLTFLGFLPSGINP